MHSGEALEVYMLQIVGKGIVGRVQPYLVPFVACAHVVTIGVGDAHIIGKRTKLIDKWS